jgi:hypothetical protein
MTKTDRNDAVARFAEFGVRQVEKLPIAVEIREKGH